MAVLSRVGRSKMPDMRSPLPERRSAFFRRANTSFSPSAALLYFSAKAAAAVSRRGTAPSRSSVDCSSRGSDVDMLETWLAEDMIDLCERLLRDWSDRRREWECCARLAGSVVARAESERPVRWLRYLAVT